MTHGYNVKNMGLETAGRRTAIATKTNKLPKFKMYPESMGKMVNFGTRENPSHAMNHPEQAGKCNERVKNVLEKNAEIGIGILHTHTKNFSIPKI